MEAVEVRGRGFWPSSGTTSRKTRQVLHSRHNRTKKKKKKNKTKKPSRKKKKEKKKIIPPE